MGPSQTKHHRTLCALALQAVDAMGSVTGCEPQTDKFIPPAEQASQ
jgi:hypothetical protein